MVVIGVGADFADTALQAIDLSEDGALLATVARNRLSVFARCATTSARDCDGDGVVDVCQVVAGANDCNDNRQPDACDIAGGISTDCDTSALATEGIDVVAHVLGVGAVPPDVEFRCLEGSVAAQRGNAVPGSPPPTGGDPQDTLGMCGSPAASASDWGHATSIIAERFAWSPGVVRLVVNLASQGPYCGSSAKDASDDAAAAWATDRASMAGVIVSSMLGADFDGPTRRPTEGLVLGLALATGGTVSREPGPSPRWGAALGDLLRDAAARGRDCDGDGVADVCALFDACADCNADGRLDVCDGPSLCEPYHRDADGDGFGDPTMAIAACDAPTGHVADASDCDDGASSVFPRASEIPGDGIDQDCAGSDICASGEPPDGGFCPAIDAGTEDAGIMDGGSADGGGPDAGAHDVGALIDVGPLDVSASLDAARTDTGAAIDAAETIDAGPPSPSEGCSCRAGTRSRGRLGAFSLALVVALVARRRRPTIG